MTPWLQVLLYTTLFVLPTFGTYAGYRVLQAHFFKRKWRGLLEDSELECKSPGWWRSIFSDDRGSIQGSYQGMPLRLTMQERSYVLQIDGEGKLPEDLWIQRQIVPTSPLSSLFKPSLDQQQLDDQTFRQHFKVEGDPAVIAAVIDQQVRDSITALIRMDDLDNFSMELRDGLMELRFRINTNGSYSPEGVVILAHQIYQACVLPKGQRRRRLALAKRLTQQLRESDDMGQQLQAGTALLEGLPDLIKRSGLMKQLKSSTKPASQWLLLYHDARKSRKFQKVADFACRESTLKELRLQAFDLLDQHAPEQLRYKTYTTCVDSRVLSIRQEAKIRLDQMKDSTAHNHKAGYLSVVEDDDAGKISMSTDNGELSLLEGKKSETP